MISAAFNNLILPTLVFAKLCRSGAIPTVEAMQIWTAPLILRLIAYPALRVRGSGR
jgi:hypothetical protein